MPRVTSNLTNFTAGEISPQLYGRVDIQKYPTGCRTLENFLVRVHGGVQRRPGTYYVAATKHAGKKARLIPFEYSTTQAYILEVGDQYMRFYKEYGQITSGSPAAPYEIATPWLEADLPKIMYAQDEDTLYLACAGYAPRVLTRNSHTSWTLAEHAFTEPPYLEENTDPDWALAPSIPVAGVQTLITNKPLFTAQHVGAAFRLQYGTTTTKWGWCIFDTYDPFNPNAGVVTVKSEFGNNYVDIEGMTSANPCVVTVTGHGLRTGDYVFFDGITQATWNGMNWQFYKITKIDADTFSLDGKNTIGWAAYVPGTDPGKVTSATRRWREGAFSTYRGWPDSVVFHEQRLIYFKDASMYASKTGNPNDFGSAFTGTPLATDGFSYKLAAEKSNIIRWAASRNNLLLGATDGVWRMGAQTSTDPVTPTNAKLSQQSRQGSALLRAHSVGHSILFVERLGLPTNTGEKVIEISYKWETDAYHGKDLTLLSEHIGAGGILDWDFQRSPFPILWCVRNDGTLLGMTYDKEQDVIGWHRHPMDGEVEAVCCIPGDDQDDLWMIVNRTVNGAVVRYVEYLTPMKYGTSVEDAFFVDCGLTYRGAAATTLSGLTHLIGKTVAVLANGTVHPPVVVDLAGQIALEYPATVAHVGLPFTSTLETVDLEGGGAEGPAQGKKRAVSKVLCRFYETGSGIEIGRAADNDTAEQLDVLDFRTASSLMGSPEPLFDGIHPVMFPRAWQREARIKVRMSNPLPASILVMAPTLKTEDA